MHRCSVANSSGRASGRSRKPDAVRSAHYVFHMPFVPSGLLRGPAPFDATIVKRLRENGVGIDWRPIDKREYFASSSTSSCIPVPTDKCHSAMKSALRMANTHIRAVAHIDISPLPPHRFLGCRKNGDHRLPNVIMKQVNRTNSDEDFNFAFLPTRGAVSEFGVFSAGAAFFQTTEHFQSRGQMSAPSSRLADPSLDFKEYFESGYPGIWICTDSLESSARLFNILGGPDEQDMLTLAFYANQTEMEKFNCGSKKDLVVKTSLPFLPREDGRRTVSDTLHPEWISKYCAVRAPKEVDLQIVSSAGTPYVSRENSGSGEADVEKGRVTVTPELLKQAAAAADLLFLCECVGQLLRLDGENA